jgi:hypothetical protein
LNSSFRYRAFGLLIDSQIELPELENGSSAELPDLRIRLGIVQRVRHKATFEEELAFNIVGAYFSIRRGCDIIVDPKPGSDPAAVRVVLLGRVMAFLLRQRGWLPLHASAVEVGGGAVLFLGAAGAGKSTTAAAFHSHGHRVLSDDVGAVRVDDQGVCLLQPSLSYVRLREDALPLLGQGIEERASYQVDKYRCDLDRRTPQSLYRVLSTYVLEYGPVLKTESVPSLEATMLLSKNSFVKHRNTEKNQLADHLRNCVAVTAAVPVRRLRRPRNLTLTSEMVELVEKEFLGGA